MIFEQQAGKRGFQHIAGVDEAGRGPLAGPVVAAACVLPRELLEQEIGINDSKKLSPEERERLYELLSQHPGVDYGIGVVDALIIDQVNILQATLQAMTAAVLKLKKQPDYIFVDGNKIPLSFKGRGEAVIGGDALCTSIGAASIIAKVTRDRMMQEYHLQWPEYGFKDHKGYPTKQHLAAIKQHGACFIHRKTFQPVREHIR